MNAEPTAPAVLALAGVLTLIYVGAVVRSVAQSRRLAALWGNSASSNWATGKLQIMAYILGMFVLFQPVWPISREARTISWFALFILGLIWGEWRMGSGFRNAADAQAAWRQLHTD